MRKSDILASLPAGRYYVGDLCYVIPHEHWSDVLNESGYLGLYPLREGEDGVLTFNRAGGYSDAAFMGRIMEQFPVGASETMYGDGGYNDQFGNYYSVDAGMIGCMRVEDIDEINPDLKPSAMEDLGAIVDFPHPFRVEYHDGLIVIGHLSIQTNWDDIEDEDDLYDDEEE